jgi:hypothetical protein
VDIVAGVQETACGDGDVVHRVTVERELKVKLDGGCAPVALGQHLVLLKWQRKYKRISRTQIAIWQHLSMLKVSTFFSWQKN